MPRSVPNGAERGTPLAAGASSAGLNLFVIGLTAFLTVVDLFATQAILPVLTVEFATTPAAMSSAVNASTIGMAVAGLLAALLSTRVNKRLAVTLSLALLAIPTALLAHTDDIRIFALLRVAQGMLMATAFTLTLAHLGERCSASASPAAFAAYVTGNVASNLIGRLIAASAVDVLGVDGNFYLFAGLNLLGAVLVALTLTGGPAHAGASQVAAQSPFAALRQHLADPLLRIAFGIGFCILFAFIGVFTYVNFVLVQPPLALGMMAIGVVYFVFAPSMLTTPLAGPLVAKFGTRSMLWLGLGTALAGLPLLVSGSLRLVLIGMVLVACGTFFAQAVATGFVSRRASGAKGVASGVYLASYFTGGIAGTTLLGLCFERWGWVAVTAGVGAALVLAAIGAAQFAPGAVSAPAKK